MKYKTITIRQFKDVPQIKKHLTPEQIEAIEVVGSVLPFKANNYVVDELIKWENVPNDPIFQLTFPQKEMLSDTHYNRVKWAMDQGFDKRQMKDLVNEIRMELNPHPAGQMVKNVPEIDGIKLTGLQHKYRETGLFFPSQGQTCHAYCTFCFRWPQFVGIDELKFGMNEMDLVVKYYQQNPQLTDILFTGGDPMVMAAKKINAYIERLTNGDIPNLKTIRFGTKSLGYWPYKFVTDKDADLLLDTFKKAVDNGYHITIMAHFNHPVELETEIVQQAIKRILATGAQIRTQSPVMKYINDGPQIWADMWQKQVELGCIPYYMFVARDTGARDYFAVTLENAWHIFRNAYKQVSGIARTVRGPSMSSDPGKVQILGINEIQGEKVMTLRFLQGRNPEWVARPFFAKYNPQALWLDDLEPAFGERSFFFEEKAQSDPYKVLKMVSNN